MMKTCPKCGRSFSDISFSFCLEDGALLSAPEGGQDDSEIETVIRLKVQGRSNKTSSQILLRRFWDLLLTPSVDQNWVSRSMRPNNRHYLLYQIGGGLYYVYRVGKHHARVELYLEHVDPEMNQKIFDRLSAHKEPIEAEFGDTLNWDHMPGRWACKIT